MLPVLSLVTLLETLSSSWKSALWLLHEPQPLFSPSFPRTPSVFFFFSFSVLLQRTRKCTHVSRNSMLVNLDLVRHKGIGAVRDLINH